MSGYTKGMIVAIVLMWVAGLSLILA